MCRMPGRYGNLPTAFKPNYRTTMIRMKNRCHLGSPSYAQLSNKYASVCSLSLLTSNIRTYIQEHSIETARKTILLSIQASCECLLCFIQTSRNSALQCQYTLRLLAMDTFPCSIWSTWCRRKTILTLSLLRRTCLPMARGRRFPATYVSSKVTFLAWTCVALRLYDCWVSEHLSSLRRQLLDFFLFV